MFDLHLYHQALLFDPKKWSKSTLGPWRTFSSTSILQPFLPQVVSGFHFMTLGQTCNLLWSRRHISCGRPSELPNTFILTDTCFKRLCQGLVLPVKYPIKRRSCPKSDANAQKYSVSDNFIDLGYTQRNIWTFLYSKQSCQNHQILNKYQLRLFVSKLETPPCMSTLPRSLRLTKDI